MPSGSNMNRLKCQGQKKKSWVYGWLAPSGTWAWTHQSAWAEDFVIRMKIYENCILNDILWGMQHAARQLVTTGVRMLPCFPCVGDGADYGTFGPQTNGKIRFLKKWYRIFCWFLNLRSHRHDSVTPSITLLLDAFGLLKLLWTLC